VAAAFFVLTPKKTTHIWLAVVDDKLSITRLELITLLQNQIKLYYGWPILLRQGQQRKKYTGVVSGHPIRLWGGKYGEAH
jgi:hypothetical protein